MWYCVKNFGDHGEQTPELRHVSGLNGDVLDILVKCNKQNMFFFRQCTRLMWLRDWPRPKLNEIWSFKLQDFNVLENTCFIFQNLNFTGAYVVLNEDSKNVLFFCHYFHFMSCPSPSQTDIRCNWNKINKSMKGQLIL